MAEENGKFKPIVESLFEGMESFLTTKTVVGEPKVVGDTTIIPLVNVSFGVGAGAFAKDSSNNGGGGLGGKMTPNALLVLKGDDVRLIRLSQGKSLDKILELVPNIINKFKGDNDDIDLDSMDITED